MNVSSSAANPRIGVRLWGLYAASKAALSALTLELCKEVAPLGIEVVLLEGGVSGQTKAWDGARRIGADSGPVHDPYRVSTMIAAAQVAAATGGPDNTANVAEMMADACEVASPPLRYPAASQVGINAANAIPDELFIRLARGDTAPELYEGVPGFWPLQLNVLASEGR